MMYYDYCRDCLYGECCETLDLFELIEQQQKETITQPDSALLLRCVFCNTWEIKTKWKNKIIITSNDNDILEDYFQDLTEGVLRVIQEIDLQRVKAPTNPDVLRKLNLDLRYSLRGETIGFIACQIISPVHFFDLLDQLNLSEKYLSPEDIEIVNKNPKDYYKLKRIIVRVLNSKILRDVTFLSKIRVNPRVERLIHEIDDAFFLKSIKEVMEIIQSGEKYLELDQKLKTKIKVFNQHLTLTIFHSAILKTRSVTVTISGPPLPEDLVFVEEIKDYLKCLITEYRKRGRSIFDFVSACIDDLKPLREKDRKQKSRFREWLDELLEHHKNAFFRCGAEGYEDALTHYSGARLVNGIERALRERIIEFTFEEIQKLRKRHRKN